MTYFCYLFSYCFAIPLHCFNFTTAKIRHIVCKSKLFHAIFRVEF
nr:MAG TPA: hypothetical protein [Caudoviricetes sp.]